MSSDLMGRRLITETEHMTTTLTGYDTTHFDFELLTPSGELEHSSIEQLGNAVSGAGVKIQQSAAKFSDYAPEAVEKEMSRLAERYPTLGVVLREAQYKGAINAVEKELGVRDDDLFGHGDHKSRALYEEAQQIVDDKIGEILKRHSIIENCNCTWGYFRTNLFVPGGSSEEAYQKLNACIADVKQFLRDEYGVEVPNIIKIVPDVLWPGIIYCTPD